MLGLRKVSSLLATRFSTRLTGWLLLLVGLAALLGLIGCGTPQERYHTLSVFFDGVPNPDAPSRTNNDDSKPQIFLSTRIVSQHKPFLDNRCAECHHDINGDIQDFELAYNACVKCHKNVSSERLLMHGPVAREQCKWCHTPHQSTEPFLLKDTSLKVCTQCHNKDLLGNNPPEHADGKTSCVQCHFGHGGTARYFLKPAAGPAGDPATAPAIPPTTIPATHPVLGLTTDPATAPTPSTPSIPPAFVGASAVDGTSAAPAVPGKERLP